MLSLECRLIWLTTHSRAFYESITKGFLDLQLHEDVCASGAVRLSGAGPLVSFLLARAIVVGYQNARGRAAGYPIGAGNVRCRSCSGHRVCARSALLEDYHRRTICGPGGLDDSFL